MFVIPSQLIAVETITSGSATKAWAGASIMRSRSAPATLYNPANLCHVKKNELYMELGLVNISYQYTYGPDEYFPDEAPVALKITAPVPMYGFAFQQSKKLSFGIMASIIPGSATSAKVERVIIRDTGDPGFKANIEIGGEGLGVDLSLGAGYSLSKLASIGLSLKVKQNKQNIKATDDETGITLIEGKTQNTASSILLGIKKVFTKNIIVGGTIVPYRKYVSKKSFTSLDDTGSLPLPKSDNQTGPLEVGIGLVLRWSKIFALTEVVYTKWSSNNKLDGLEALYKDTLDMKAGVGFATTKGQMLNVSYGLYESNIGDGILADKTEDGKELRGFKFGDIESIAVNIFSFGYKIRRKRGVIQTYAAYKSGIRKVDDLSPAFGTHRLTGYHVGGSYTYRF